MPLVNVWGGKIMKLFILILFTLFALTGNALTGDGATNEAAMEAKKVRIEAKKKAYDEYRVWLNAAWEREDTYFLPASTITCRTRAAMVRVWEKFIMLAYEITENQVRSVVGCSFSAGWAVPKLVTHRPGSNFVKIEYELPLSNHQIVTRWTNTQELFLLKDHLAKLKNNQ